MIIFFPKAVLLLPWWSLESGCGFILFALSLLPWCCLCSSILKLRYCCCSFAFRIIWKPSSYIYGWFWGKITLIFDLVKVSFVISWKIEFQQSCKLCPWLWGWSFLINKKNCIGVSVVRWQLFDWFYSLTLFRKCVACCEAWLVNLVYWWQTWLKTFR